MFHARVQDARLYAARDPGRTARSRCTRQGIHGTIFYGLEHKRQYYPTLKDEEAINTDGSRLRAGGRWKPPS